MDLGFFLILVAVGFILTGASVTFTKKRQGQILNIFAILLGLVNIQTAIADNASNGGQGFVSQTALSSAGTYVLRYQPLVPIVYLGIFAILIAGILLVRTIFK